MFTHTAETTPSSLCYHPGVILPLSRHLQQQKKHARMVSTVTYGLLLACVALPGLALGDLAFRCPSCTADLLAACPKIPPFCPEIVRELGCGCCPVCARQEGELCGVYTPRCSSGLRCYPSAEAELPLQQLIQGTGRCGQRVEMDIYSTSLDEQATNGK